MAMKICFFRNVTLILQAATARNRLTRILVPSLFGGLLLLVCCMSWAVMGCARLMQYRRISRAAGKEVPLPAAAGPACL
jgi:hypothetical protein